MSPVGSSADRATGSPLLGRTALVSGASRGIGLAIARVLVHGGARVAMLARGEAELRERAAELGSSAMALTCDVGDPEAARQAAGEVADRFGGAPDILVNNAGLFALARVDESTVTAFHRMLDVNLVGPFVLLREFLPEMRARGRGHVVTIGSIADHRIFPENGSYSASKFGLRALHEVARLESKGTGVRATLVSPGPVNTGLWDEVQPDDRAAFTHRREMLSPDAVAAAVLFAVTQPDDVNVDELRLSRS